MGEMIHLMRQMVNQSPNISGSPNFQKARSNSIDEATSDDSGLSSSFSLKPVQFIRDLQIECFGERNQFTTDAGILGDVVSQGIVDAKLSMKLIELYVFRPLPATLCSLLLICLTLTGSWTISASGSP